MNSAVSALRFFFGVTLDRPDMERHLTFVSEPRKLPVVRSELLSVVEGTSRESLGGGASVIHNPNG
jgi:hypothetical protein